MPENSKASKLGLMLSDSERCNRSQRHLYLKIWQLFAGNTRDKLYQKLQELLAELMCSISVDAVRSWEDRCSQNRFWRICYYFAKFCLILYSLLVLKIHMYCFEINGFTGITWSRLSGRQCEVTWPHTVGAITSYYLLPWIYLFQEYKCIFKNKCTV